MPRRDVWSGTNERGGALLTQTRWFNSMTNESDLMEKQSAQQRLYLSHSGFFF